MCTGASLGINGGSPQEPETMTALVDAREHRELHQHQIAAYHDTRKSLSTGQLLLLMDFSALQLPVNNSDRHNVDGVSKVVDFIIVCEWREEETGVIKHVNLDFLCDDPNTNKNDYYFIHQSLQFLFFSSSFLSPFDHIIIWTDGGPYQFPTNQTQYLFYTLSNTAFKRITHNLFAPYHGHSMADGHAGHVKHTIKQAYIHSEGQRQQGELEDGPQNAQQIKPLIEQNCIEHNHITLVIVFPHIDRNPALKSASLVHIPSIKQYKCFDYYCSNCTLYERSNEAVYTPVVHEFTP